MSHSTDFKSAHRAEDAATFSVLDANYAITRRGAMKALLGLAGAATLFAHPGSAWAATATQETLEKLSDAQSQYEAVQSQLDDIAAQFQTLSEQQNKTMSQIEDVQDEIDLTQTEIDKKQKQLEKRQAELGERVSDSYKNGGSNMLMMLLNSSSFEELIANSHYVEKINENDRAVIADVRQIKADLDTKKSDLESQKSDLEELKESQAKQMKEMQAKQEEAQTLLNNLSDEVKQLMEQRDAEIVAAAAAEAEAERQRQAAASSASSSSGSKAGNVTGGSGQSASAATGSQQKVVSACHSVASPGYGLCAAWVSNVFQAAGLGFIGGNANDMYNYYCSSSNKDNLKVGMIIAVSSHSHTLNGQIYGHVGIYIGNNTVMDNIGSIRSISLDSWISYYSTTVTPRWGWLGGIVLS